MFKKLKNEAKLTFTLEVVTPLLINSGNDNKITPGYDMSPTKMNDGTVYIPGSSAKGVFRTRYEQLIKAIDERYKICNIVNPRERCSINEGGGTNNESKGIINYFKSCMACRLFGNLSLGSRINFADAFPLEIEGNENNFVLGHRHGVGIDRTTGAAQRNAKFDYEMVERGAFNFNITMTNFALYQLRIVLWVLQDINEGFVTFGMGGTRGNGRLKLSGNVELDYRDMTGRETLSDYWDNELKISEEISEEIKSSIFGVQAKITGLDNIISAIGIDSRKGLAKAIESEESHRKAGRTNA